MQPQTLYSIWRDSDDSLIILDGTADQCCELLGVRKETFYRYACRSEEQKMYTIEKIIRVDAEREAEE